MPNKVMEQVTLETMSCKNTDVFRKYMLQSQTLDQLYLATAGSLYQDSCFNDHYGRYLLQKKQILSLLYPRSLFIY